jgi:hypothetical protein
MRKFVRDPGVNALVGAVAVAVALWVAAYPFWQAGHKGVALILIVGGVLVALFCVWAFVEILRDQSRSEPSTAPPLPAISMPNNQGVVSVAQSGGITAQQVNIGRQERTLRPGIPMEMFDRLKQYAGTKFDLHYEQSAPDAYRLSQEIEHVLTSAGWLPVVRGFMMRFPPLTGIFIHAPGESLVAGTELRACLTELGLLVNMSSQQVHPSPSLPGVPSSSDGGPHVEVAVCL